MESGYQRQQGRWLHRTIVLVALITCLRVWAGPVGWIDRAEAQRLDPGQQRNLQLKELRRTNAILTEIKDLLASQTFNVRGKGADNQAPAPRRP